MLRILIFEPVTLAHFPVIFTRNVEVVGLSPSKGPVVSVSKKRYPYCLVPVGSRNGFESDSKYKIV